MKITLNGGNFGGQEIDIEDQASGAEERIIEMEDGAGGDGLIMIATMF